MDPAACLRCGKRLEEGFLLDRARHDSGRAEWILGKPQPGWLGVGVRLRGTRRFGVAPFRWRVRRWG